MPKQLTEAIEKAINSRLWGTISIQFQDGEPVILREERTTKLSSERMNNRHEQKYR